MIAGRLTVHAAINAAGVVLSQPVVRTTPSKGYPYNTSTNERYAKFLSNAAVGLLPVSCIGWVGNSIGIPPASLIPFLICFESSKKCLLHGTKSLPDWAIPIIGFPDWSSSFFKP